MGSARKKLNTLRKIANAKFEERLHLRNPAGSKSGGRFTHSPLGGGRGESTSTPAPGRAILIIATPGLGSSGWEIEEGHVVPGRKTTTLFELAAIGADDTGVLTPDQVGRLHVIRNQRWGRDYDQRWSYEKNLASPPNETGNTPIYLGDRVKMFVGGEGNVTFSVDDSYSVDEYYATPRPKPSKELIEMQMAFMDYLQSPSSNRPLTNMPVYDTEERFRTRVKAYTAAGFKASWEHPLLESEPRDGFMYLDNRKNPTTFAEIFEEEGIGVIYLRGTEIRVER